MKGEILALFITFYSICLLRDCSSEFCLILFVALRFIFHCSSREQELHDVGIEVKGQVLKRGEKGFRDD